jgi:hypothetical protein
MGISVTQLRYILSNRKHFHGAEVASISVQYPPDYSHLKRLANLVPPLLSRTELVALADTNERSFMRKLFLDILKANYFVSIDISDEEGAEVICDLGAKISDLNMAKLGAKFDVVIEGGTMEHILNTKTFLENVFKLLKIGGIYISSAPSSGYLEHGFYQFSPTFYYDLEYYNSKLLFIDALSLGNETVFIDLLRVKIMTQRCDASYSSQEPFFLRSAPGIEDFDIFSGTLISLVNRHGIPMMINCIMRKRQEGDEISFQGIQSEYRLNTLGDICPTDGLPISNWTSRATNGRLKIRNAFKSFVIRIYLPFWFKLNVLRVLVRVIKCLRGS